MSDYDVVVIGAGNGGLTSALSLAKNGLKVLLLERHNIPGGCATSFIRGRFEFEVALHQLSGLGTVDFPGPVRHLFNDLGVMDKLEFVQMENLYRVAIPGELDINLKADRTQAVMALQERFPGEASNIERFFDLLYEYCNQWIKVNIFHDPKASPETCPVYFQYTLKPTQSVFNSFFEDPLLQSVLGVYSSYLGMPLDKLSYGMFAITLWAYMEFKPWHLKGGSQALSNALLDEFISAGGDVRFNCGAQQIMVANGRVTGVRTEKGDDVSTLSVVSNAGMLTTYVDLIDEVHVPDPRLRELGARSLGTSFVTVFMGFDCEPSQLGIQHATNFIGNTTDARKTNRTTRTLEDPTFTLFTCYDVDDPDFSPKGACQASLVALCYAEPWMTVSPQHYFDTKMAYADGMLDLVTMEYPDLRSHIEEIDIGTPLTHMRYLGHPGGAAYGFEQYVKNSNLFMNRKSPIEGLFHAGAWSGSGGGFQPTLLSGATAAKDVIHAMQK